MKNLGRGFLLGLIVMSPLLPMNNGLGGCDSKIIDLELGLPDLHISSLANGIANEKKSQTLERGGLRSALLGRVSLSPSIEASQLALSGSPRGVSNGMLPGDGNSSPTFRHVGVTSVTRLLDLESLIYERATVEDADDLMAIYDNFNSDDRHRLLVFPGFDSDGILNQRKALLASLEKRRVFVARLPSSRQIVAFLKLFVIEDQDELRDILKNELRALQPSTSRDASSVIVGGEILTECAPCDAASCELDTAFVYDFSRKPDYSSDLPVPIFKYKPESTYVYYGGAYTLLETCRKGKDYRGLGINFKLEQKALEIISIDIQRNAFINSSKEIFYVYGVVQANATTTARLRAASIMIRVLLTDLKIKIVEPIRLSSFAFRAFKPSFYQEAPGQPLKIFPDQLLNSGFGTLIGYRIRD
jgi:hypothetical protein